MTTPDPIPPPTSPPATDPHENAGVPRIRCGPQEPDRGSLMLYMVPISVILMLFAGLVFDGGTAITARGRAADLAAQAARAGANALDPASLRTGHPVTPRVDPAAAHAAAIRVLTAAGATGTLTVHGADTVSVTATVPARTAILSAIGLRDVSGTATATATVLHGLSTPQGGP